MMQKAQNWLSWPVGVLHGLNVWLILPTIITVVLADILMRAIWQAPLAWAHEVLGLLLFCLFFLALPKCLALNELIRVELAFRAFPSYVQKVIAKVGHLLMALTGFLMGWQSLVACREMYQYGETAYTIAIPYWPFAGLGFVCCVLAVLQSLVSLFGHVSGSQIHGGDG